MLSNPMAVQPEFVARQITAEDFPRLFELCYARLPGIEKDYEEALKEFTTIFEPESILALGIERFENGIGTLVACAIGAFVTRELITELIDNKMPDVQRFLRKFKGRWYESPSEMEKRGDGRGASLLVLYYRVEGPPYCLVEEFQDIRQILHDKWFDLCGGFRISRIVAELWEEPAFEAWTRPAEERGLGFRVVNKYTDFKSSQVRFMRKRELCNAPCLLEISNWEHTTDQTIKKLLRYKSPIYGLTAAQRKLLRADYGLLPLCEVNKKAVHPLRQRLYQRLERDEFSGTWLGSQLRALKDAHGKKAVVDSYFRDHLQELRP